MAWEEEKYDWNPNAFSLMQKFSGYMYNLLRVVKGIGEQ